MQLGLVESSLCGLSALNFQGFGLSDNHNLYQ